MARLHGFFNNYASSFLCLAGLFMYTAKHVYIISQSILYYSTYCLLRGRIKAKTILYFPCIYRSKWEIQYSG